MPDLHYERSDNTPEIVVDSEQGYLLVQGKSYPENAVSVYKPVIDMLQEILSSLPDQHLRADFKLQYFNSSSAKALMRLAAALDDFAAEGGSVDLNWYHHEDDDVMREFAEDLSEELEAVNFVFCPYT